MRSFASAPAIPATGRHAHRKAWVHVLLAIGLLLASVLVDLHAVGHIGDGANVDCEVCLLTGGLDHGLVPAVVVAGYVALRTEIDAEPVPLHRPSPISAYRSRAPPSTVSA